jgi:putative ABC transport system permease protein
MLKIVGIVWHSFRMALQELRNNKLRTFLSLFGITIGIFCIISVLATVESLESKIQNDIKSLGSNTIYIDKWEYGSGDGGSFPWWKYYKRPLPQYRDMEAIKERSELAEAVSFSIRGNGTLEYNDLGLTGVTANGVSEDFHNVVTVEVDHGRYISESEFSHGTPVMLMGATNAVNLFGSEEKAVGKEVKFKNRNVKIIGIIRKTGKSFVGAWEFDEQVIMPYKMLKTLIPEENGNPIIMVKGNEKISSQGLTDELRGIMRSLHQLSPKQDDDFALNDINIFSERTSQLFGSVNLGGMAIAGLSLIVGMFGVANIMFVTVRERTSQIGLKKAIGAKRSTILVEFLLESAFLCLLGGLIGLALVFLLTQLLSFILPFSISISLFTLTLAISICLIVGVLAGIIPASIASKMDPVVAIRMK